MAGGITFYTLMRRIHFFSSVFVVLFCIMYMLTGFVLAKSDWFPGRNAVEQVKTFSLNTPVDTNHADQLIRTLKKQYCISGRTGHVLVKPDGTVIANIFKPGLQWNVRIHATHDSITIKRSEQQTIRRVSSNLHMLRGFAGEWQYIVWAVLYDISAVAFIIFTLTGILIWARNNRMFRTGWFVIIPVTVLTIIVFVFLAM